MWPDDQARFPENHMIDHEFPLSLEKRDWAEIAKGMIKAEMKRRNWSYSDLVEALDAVGVKESEANLRNKISRGNFSAVFMLQTLDAIGCTVQAVPRAGSYSGTRRYPELTARLRSMNENAKSPVEDQSDD